MDHLRSRWCPLCPATSVHYVVKSRAPAQFLEHTMSAADLRRGEFGPGDHGEITGLASRSKSSQKGRRPFLWGLLHEYDIRALLADVRPRVGGLHWGRTVARRGVLSGHLAVECERLGNAKVGGANGAAQRVDAGKSNGQGAEQRHYEDERTGRDAAEVFTALQFICLLRRWTGPGWRGRWSDGRGARSGSAARENRRREIRLGQALVELRIWLAQGFSLNRILLYFVDQSSAGRSRT